MIFQNGGSNDLCVTVSKHDNGLAWEGFWNIITIADSPVISGCSKDAGL